MDGNSLTFVERKFNHLPLTTKEDCTKAIFYSTGKGATDKAQGSYFKDHYFPKAVKASDFTAKKAIGPKNFLPMTYTFDSQGNVVKAADGAKQTAKESALTYTNRVGAMYMLFNCIESMVNLQATLQFNLAHMTWLNDGTLVYPAGELYEGGPLGGLNWSNNVIVDYLTDVMFGKEKVKQGVNVPEYINNIQKTDFNYQDTRPNAYLMAASHMATTKATIKALTPEEAVSRPYTEAEFIGIVSMLNFWFTKGQLDLNKEERLKYALAYLGLATSFDLEELGEQNVMVKFLNYAVPSLLKSFNFRDDEGNSNSAYREWLLETVGLDTQVDLDPNSFVVR